jgi:putative aldouronate transport system substrate-binding protein
VKHDMIEVSVPFFTTETPATPSAQIQQKTTGIGKIIKEYSWKMIYAKNESEYNQLRGEMISKAKGLGYDEVVQYEVDLANKTVFPHR